MKVRKVRFNDVVDGQEGLLKGPFGSDLKKTLYVPKGIDTYKVYLQENILKRDISKGKHYISKDYFDNNMQRYEVKEGDFIVTCDGTLGEIFQLNGLKEKGIISSSLLRITLNPKIINHDYFPYLWQQRIKHPLIRSHENSVLKHLPGLNAIRNFEFEIPELATQKKIGSILSNLDSKIELNNRINAELEAMAKTIYDYWFVQFDFPFDFAQGKPDKNGRRSEPIELKPYKSSGGKMVWNEELKREIPEGWEVKELGDYIELFDSKRIPLSSRERALKKGIIPYYGATGVMDFVDEYIFDDEFILLAEDGSVMDEKGYPIIQFIWGKTWVNNHAHVIQASNSIQNEFFFYHMKTIPVILIKTGSIQMKINQENLKKHRVLIPDDNLINQFSSFANSIRNILKNNIEQNQQLTSLRDWLLPILMNGQVKVN